MGPDLRGAPAARLRGRTFYGIIVACVIAGALILATAGRADLESAGGRPMGRRIWEGVADHFVVPICVMIGATFGGLLGLATAIVLDFRARRRRSNPSLR